MSDATAIDVEVVTDHFVVCPDPALDAAYEAAFGAVSDLLRLDGIEFEGQYVGPTFRLETLLMVAVDMGWTAATRPPLARDGAAS